MTTNDQQPASYPWRAAPSHLKTRRQLRAAGLSPGGQDVAALMVRQRRGRRLVAHLFDIALARPKRVPSPAQLEAIEKATRTHQLRAAERRGWTEADLHTPTDLGSTWSETPTLEEEPTMNTTDSAVARPQGHGQRRAWLHALVATNQARDRRDRLDADLEQAARAGENVEAEFMAGLRRDLDAAEERLAAVRGIGDPYNDTVVLADALYWSAGSPVATDLAEQITSGLAAEWGVRVDPETWVVTVDPGFDAAAAQTDAETRAVRAREAAIVEAVAGLPLPDHTAAAVNWTVQAWADTAAPGAELGARREQLREDLAGVQCSEGDRKLLGFTVDYLTGHTSEIDLLDTPVLVDPGHEVRGRAQELLSRFGDGRLAPAGIAAEIAVMTAADQQVMRDAGRAIVTDSVVEHQVWPEWADRDQTWAQLHEYAIDAREHCSDIDQLAAQDLTDEERDRLGVSDDIGARIERLAEARMDLLDTAATSKGLTVMERQHLTAVVREIDTGIIGSETELPDLMWVDERSKAAVDDQHSYTTGSRPSKTVTEDLTQLIARAGVDLNDHDHRPLKLSVALIACTLDKVAAGGSLSGMDSDREEFLTRRAQLGQGLRDTGIGSDAMTAIREALDSHARTAGQTGHAANDRRDRWRERIDRIAAARDDAAAQRQAATAGHPSGPGRTCTAGPALTTPPAGPTHSPHIRHLHSESEEVGR